jgi:Heme/copper-type cytochrome/quinol oxidases, subunit 2
MTSSSDMKTLCTDWLRTRTWIAAGTLLFILGACDSAGRASRGAAYVPRSRAITVTTVPLLVKEGQTVYPFLKSAFAKGGVLEGKEVYAFSPSTITVVQGDTIHFTFINPEDDVHSFVLPDFVVSLPGGKETEATYIAKHAGIFRIVCAVQSHLPMMSGELVVLPARTMSGEDEVSAGRM